MKNKTKNNCRVCGGRLTIKDLKGNVMPWKEFLHVELISSFKIETCDACEDFMLSGVQIKQLDIKIEESIREKTSAFLKALKHSSGLSQKLLSKRIGVTDAYLSGLIGKKKTASYQIFNLIKILSNNPETLSDLDCFAGKCDDSVRRFEGEVLKDKFLFVSDKEIEQFSGSADFIGICDNNVSGVLH